MSGIGTPSQPSSAGGGGSSTITSPIGQKAMTSSVSVVIASDQSAVPITGTVTANAGTGVFTIQTNASVNLAQVAGNTTQTAGANGVLAIGGKDAEGIAPGSNPLPMGIVNASGLAYIASATAATGGTGARLLGAGILGWDYVANYQRVKTDSSGKLYIATVDTLTSITNTVTVSGSVTANQGSANATPWNENIAQINGITPLMGNGVTGTGSLRVTVASDNTAFAVNATLSAETTKVIGTVNQGTSPWSVSLAAETTKVIGVVRTADGTGNLFTSNSTTTVGKFGLDTNILSILGTAPTTAGKLDVKGADGDVFVRQTNAANLLATVNIASAQTLATVTTVSTVTSITNNVNVVGTKTNNNAVPGATNVGALVGIANAAQQSWTEGDQILESMDLKGNQRTRISDAAGNDRGVNVTANNELQVIPTKKDTYGTTTTFTITLASLASSTAGVGRQSTLVTSNTAISALIAVKFTVGTTPTANSLIYVYLIRGDGTLNDDNAGASDAGLTVINTPLLGTILCSAATSNVAYYGMFDTKFLGSLGKTFGIAIVNSTGATANATGGNFSAEYTLIT